MQEERPSVRLTLGWFLAAALAIALLGLLGGMAFGRAAPERAAAALLRDLASATPAPAAVPATAPPPCGMHDQALDEAAKVAAWSRGIVVVEHAGDPDVMAALNAWVADGAGAVVVAPGDGLGAPVVASAWAWRMDLDKPDRALLDAFVTAYGRRHAPRADGGADGEGGAGGCRDAAGDVSQGRGPRGDPTGDTARAAQEPPAPRG